MKLAGRLTVKLSYPDRPGELIDVESIRKVRPARGSPLPGLALASGLGLLAFRHPELITPVGVIVDDAMTTLINNFIVYPPFPVSLYKFHRTGTDGTPATPSNYRLGEPVGDFVEGTQEINGWSYITTAEIVYDQTYWIAEWGLFAILGAQEKLFDRITFPARKVTSGTNATFTYTLTIAR